MADAFETFTKLVQSPPGQLAAGGALALIVWKFFERVESVLNENTKLEIAVWLLGLRAERHVEPWPNTFLNLFDRVFGYRHFTVRCFARSAIASLAALLLAAGIYFVSARLSGSVMRQITVVLLQEHLREFWGVLLLGLITANIIPGYISLLVTRVSLSAFRLPRRVWVIVVGIIALLVIISAIAFVGMKTTEYVTVAYLSRHHHPVSSVYEDLVQTFGTDWPLAEWEFIFVRLSVAKWLWFYPAYFGCIWFLLYAGSGFLLKAARRFDIGFGWFNRTFDIEKKPLQSIGLVSGCIVALLYWTVAVIHNYL